MTQSPETLGDWCERCDKNRVSAGEFVCAACKHPLAICMNAYDAQQEYTDNPDAIAGWSVYARQPTDTPGEFIIHDNEDVRTREDADRLASDLAEKHKTTDIRVF